jgi:Fe-S cluster assembly scaffold protein SufB
MPPAPISAASPWRAARWHRCRTIGPRHAARPDGDRQRAPELEIFADDVKCAHGCAVGELDAQGLFYLQSRGLPPADAKKLMLQAFIAEAFVGAADEDALTQAALKALEGLL